MRTELITAPPEEPLSIEEVRMHLRNPEATTNDDELDRMIQSAREMVEQKTGFALLTQTWDVYLDGFPGYYIYGVNGGFTATDPIPLPYPPLQSVTSVKYSDGTTLQTMDAADYVINRSVISTSLSLGYNKSWPVPVGLADSVVIRIKVGWVDAEFVPASIKNWMLLAIESMDKSRGLNREREAFVTPFADRLLDRYKVVSI